MFDVDISWVDACDGKNVAPRDLEDYILAFISSTLYPTKRSISFWQIYLLDCYRLIDVDVDLGVLYWFKLPEAGLIW